jgi:hexosaminidase
MLLIFLVASFLTQARLESAARPHDAMELMQLHTDTFLRRPNAVKSHAVTSHKVVRPLSLLATSSNVSKVSSGAAVSVWPMPRNVFCEGKDIATVSSQLAFVGDIRSPRMMKIIERYRDLLFPHQGAADGTIQTVSVALGNGTGESYTMKVTPKAVKIEAEAPVGVQYALETLSQLVAFDFDKSQYVTQPVLPLTIKDEPRFKHRGLLIDSARHFLPVRALKRLISSVSYAKLNRLHWHITDAQSFPIDSRVEPSLAKEGAWSSRERYTMEDIKDVVAFAEEHGITVVPEFDMPGHTTSWGRAHPELMALTQDRNHDGNTGALNPTKEGTLKLVKSLLEDWMSKHTARAAFFEGPLLHLGTDEVPYDAWAGLGDSRELFNSFVGKITQIGKDLGKEVVLWEEAFKDGTPSKDAIIQVWLDANLARHATDAGNRIILSQGWYLDHLDDTWEAMYSRDPARLVNSQNVNLLLGGEGCMWGETVDVGDLEQTVWPRLGAIAERLWSDAGGQSAEAKPRLESFRCLLLERGIPCGTLEGGGRSTPTGPGSCCTQ